MPHVDPFPHLPWHMHRVALCLKSLVALMASDAASPATYRAIHVIAHGFSPTPQLHKILEVRACLAASSVP